MGLFCSHYLKKITAKYVTPATSAEIGMVKIQAHSKLMVIPHRTAETLLVSPTPIIAPVMVCVVDTGIPKCSVIKSVIAPEVSAATPSKGVTFVIRVPMVFTIFQPPLNVPKEIIKNDTNGTQK